MHCIELQVIPKPNYAIWREVTMTSFQLQLLKHSAPLLNTSLVSGHTTFNLGESTSDWPSRELESSFCRTSQVSLTLARLCQREAAWLVWMTAGRECDAWCGEGSAQCTQDTLSAEGTLASASKPPRRHLQCAEVATEMSCHAALMRAFMRRTQQHNQARWRPIYRYYGLFFVNVMLELVSCVLHCLSYWKPLITTWLYFSNSQVKFL